MLGLRLPDLKLKSLERKLKRKYQEAELIKSFSESLSKDGAQSLSEIMTKLKDPKDVEGGLAVLSRKDDSYQRDIILKALKCLKDGR
jgi:hypothetical protein